MQNPIETEDLRVRRTRTTLQKALIELTVEKGFAAVTVRDLCERAMVNRSTFYRHYIDKYDLLDQYATEVGKLTAPELNEGDGKHRGPLQMLKHVQQFADFYRVMLGQNGDPVFTQRFRQNAAERFRVLLSLQDAPTDPDAPPLEMKLNYIACAGVGAIIWWLENDQPCTPEQLGSWLSQLSTSTLGIIPSQRPPLG